MVLVMTVGSVSSFARRWRNKKQSTRSETIGAERTIVYLDYGHYTEARIVSKQSNSTR